MRPCLKNIGRVRHALQIRPLLSGTRANPLGLSLPPETPFGLKSVRASRASLLLIFSPSPQGLTGLSVQDIFTLGSEEAG